MSRLKKNGGITLGIPTIEDIEFVSTMVRDSDRKDLEGLHPGKTVKDIIMNDVKYSKVVYGLYLNGVIHGVFGVIPLDKAGKGTPWVVGTKGVDKCPLMFARTSQSLLDMLQKCFPVLDTWVCCENSISLSWHSWCGFEFDKKKIRIGRDNYFRAVRSVAKKRKEKR